jgi:3-oxoacyl-(acyl-carrier-protein) synthase III
MTTRVKISHVSSYFDTTSRVDNGEIERRVNHDKTLLPPGVLDRLFGVRNRFFANDGVQCSDLAAGAARKILQETDAKSIDCMIFAAASSDLIEPATANIVQVKLGLDCPVFDVKNACNSFVSAMQVAASFVKSGQYKKVLITNGEILQNAITYNITDNADLMKRIASFTLGDAGTAAILEASDDESGIIYHDMRSLGEYWELCVIPGGGSMFPQDCSKHFFEGKTAELRDVFIREKGEMFEKCFRETGYTRDDIDHFFIHQVSKGTVKAMADDLNIPIEKFHCIIEEYGNTAAASIPLSIDLALKAGKLKKGQKVIIIGLAAGISMSVQLMIW